MTNLQKLRVVAAAALFAVSLGACSGQVELPEPEMSGPWGPELQHAYDWETNPEAKDVLADGVITDKEIEKIKAAQISCLENLGCTVFEVNPEGSSSILVPQEEGESREIIMQRTNDLQQQCGVQTGWSSVAWFYTAMKANPENQDRVALMAQCLVRVGLEAEGYTPEEYVSDLEEDHFLPYLENKDTPEGQKFAACNEDPLHAQ